MNTQPLAMPVAFGSAASRSIVFVAAAWRAATPKHFLYTFVLALAWSGFLNATQSSFWAQTMPWGPQLNGLLTMQFNGFAVLLAVLLADHASPPPLRRWWLYVLAVVVGAVVGSSLLWFVTQRLFEIRTAYAFPEAFETYLYRHGTHALVVCGMVTFVYVSRRWATARLAALRAVQLERTQVEKRVLESRLAAMQARVEPQFLRNTLAQVERLYDINAQAADRVLKELITYLRAAIPQIRDPASTLAREIQLANAYLNIVGARSKNWLVVSDTGTPTADVARMPPMVLLPLVNHALAHRVERARGDERFLIDVVVREEKLMLTIRDQGAGFTPGAAGDTEIQHIRERLAVLYGDRARLTFGVSVDGSEAVVEIPYEPVVDMLTA
jgi:sensor histidine kinase YesM